MSIQPVMWLGLVGVAGCLGAMAAARLRLPGAAGAMVAGLLLRLAASWWEPAAGAPAPATELMTLATSAFVCFALGCCLELRVVRQRGGQIMAAAFTQALLVMVLVVLAGYIIGMGGGLAIGLGGAVVAGSPAAMAAVAFEMRARGEATQRLFALSAASLLMASVAGYLVSSIWTPVLACLAALGGGAVAGVVLLVPLSRLETRGSMLACAGAGALLLTAAASRAWQPAATIALASIVAGFVCGTLSARRDALRETLRDAAAPGAVLLFALWGASVSPDALKSGVPLALAIVAARAAALMLAGFLHVSGPGAREGLALLPMGAPLAATAPALAAATLLSQIAGLAAVRRWLARSGETTSDDPEAWRARMR